MLSVTLTGVIFLPVSVSPEFTDVSLPSGSPQNSLPLLHETESQKRNFHFPSYMQSTTSGKIKFEHYQLKKKTDMGERENKEKMGKKQKGSKKLKERNTRNKKNEGKRNRK